MEKMRLHWLTLDTSAVQQGNLTMIDVSTITTSLEALGGISSLVSTLSKKLDRSAASQSLSAELGQLNGLVLTATQHAVSSQAKEVALAREVTALKDELKNLKAFRLAKDNYELEQVDYGAFVYAYSPVDEHQHSPHWLCCNCFDNDRKSILQNSGPDMRPGRIGYNIWKCSSCNSEVRMQGNFFPQES